MTWVFLVFALSPDSVVAESRELLRCWDVRGDDGACSLHAQVTLCSDKYLEVIDYVLTVVVRWAFTLLKGHMP